MYFISNRRAFITFIISATVLIILSAGWYVFSRLDAAAPPPERQQALFDAGVLPEATGVLVKFIDGLPISEISNFIKQEGITVDTCSELRVSSSVMQAVTKEVSTKIQSVTTSDPLTENTQSGDHAPCIQDLDIWKFTAPPGTTARELAIQLSQRGNKIIEFVEEDKSTPALFIPNDPYYNDVNGVYGVLSSQWYLPEIGADLAWDLAPRRPSAGPGSIVAVLDTGVNKDHQDLRESLLTGFSVHSPNHKYKDYAGHGTMVTGLVSAVTNNSLKVAGTAFPNNYTHVLPVKITRGSNGWSTFSTMAFAIEKVRKMGVKIVNLSFGHESQTVYSAAKKLANSGGILVAAAGNQAEFTLFERRELVTVYSTEQHGELSFWSARGFSTIVGAPGGAIRVLHPSYGEPALPGFTDIRDGTSFSSPIVAAVISMIWQANPSIPRDKVINVLSTTASLSSGYTGIGSIFGRVDALKSVQVAKLWSTNSDRKPPKPTNLMQYFESYQGLDETGFQFKQPSCDSSVPCPEGYILKRTFDNGKSRDVARLGTHDLSYGNSTNRAIVEKKICCGDTIFTQEGRYQIFAYNKFGTLSDGSNIVTISPR